LFQHLLVNMKFNEGDGNAQVLAAIDHTVTGTSQSLDPVRISGCDIVEFSLRFLDDRITQPGDQRPTVTDPPVEANREVGAPMLHYCCPLNGKTAADRCPVIRAPAFSVAARSGSGARCAYRCVV